MRPTPDPVKTNVLEFWLAGETYRQIAAKTALSLGAISKIIERYRQEVPDVDEVRRLLAELNQAQIGLSDARRAAHFLQTLDSWGVDANYLPQCLAFVKEAGERLPELASAGLRLIQLEKKTGRSYGQILAEFNARVEGQDELSRRIKELEGKELELKASILHVEKLTSLKETIEKNNLTPSILQNLIHFELRLQQLGFTSQVAELLAQELAGRGLDPASAARQLATLLKNYSSLEEANIKAEDAYKKRKSKLDDLTNTTESLNKRLGLMEEQLQNLETSYEERKATLQRTYEALESRLPTEHAAKTQKIEAEIKRLEEKAAGLRMEIQTLQSAKKDMDEAEAALKTIEHSVNRSRTLTTIVSLIENPDALTASPQALEAMLAVSQSFQNFLGASNLTQATSLKLYTAADGFIRVLAEELTHCS